MTLFADPKAALSLAKNQQFYFRTKHNWIEYWHLTLYKPAWERYYGI